MRLISSAFRWHSLVSLLFTVAPISAFSALPFVSFVPQSNWRMMTTGSTELESDAAVIATNADPDSNTAATATTMDQFHLPWRSRIGGISQLCKERQWYMFGRVGRSNVIVNVVWLCPKVLESDEKDQVSRVRKGIWCELSFAHICSYQQHITTFVGGTCLGFGQVEWLMRDKVLVKQVEFLGMLGIGPAARQTGQGTCDNVPPPTGDSGLRRRDKTRDPFQTQDTWSISARSSTFQTVVPSGWSVL